MITTILSLLKNKWTLYAAIALCAVLFIGGLWLRGSYYQGKYDKLIAKQNEEKVKIYEAFAKNAEASLKAMDRQQKIENNLSSIKRRIDEMTPSKCLEGNDEKVFTDITWSFNNFGMSPEQCTASKKGVPQTIKTCVDNTNWTTQQIARNYEELMKSYINLEETVKCYENQ